MESSSSHAFHGPFFGVTAYFGRQIYLNQTLSGPLVLASPLDACAPPRIGDDDGDAAPLHLPEGAVVLVQRGGCNFTDKARAVEAAGGVAMLLYDNVPGCITMGGGAETPVSLTIPSVSISQESGDRLVALLSSTQELKATLSAVVVSSVDGSSLVLWLMAVGTVIGGSLWAGRDHLAARKGGLPGAAGNEGPSGPPEEETVDITVKAAIGFVFLASGMLLFIFFLFNEFFFYVLLIFFCLAAIQATAMALSALIDFATPQLSRRLIAIPRLGLCPLSSMVSVPVSTSLAVVWAVMRHEDWSWILQDILGICLMLFVLRTLRLTNLKVACILLPLTFFYDIFWVFIQPLIFGGGKSVMVEVAEGGGLDESLPMLLRVPYLGLPKELGAYSMLGFGDIILPGLLVAYLRKVDLDLFLLRGGSLSRPSSPRGSGSGGGGRLMPGERDSWGSNGWTCPWACLGYWIPCCVAYALGLMLTYLALVFSWFGNQGQPALLYLVPCTLGTTLLLGWIRGDLPAMWEGVTGKLSTANSAGKPAGEGDEESPGARLSGSVHDDDEDSTQMATERTALLGGNPNSHAPK